MPLKVRSYLPSDFNAWLDLTATSSIELNEEFLIWNQRPILPAKSFSFLFSKENQLIASADLTWQNKNQTFLVKHWASRKMYSKSEFAEFLQEITLLTKSPVQIWVSSPELIEYFINKPTVKIIEKRVAFFIEGSVLPDLSQSFGFCDHIYGTCSMEVFPEIASSLPIAKKDFMKPKFQTCLEFSLP